MSEIVKALKAMAQHPNRRLMRRHLHAVALEILEGKGTPAQIGSFLMALRMMGETGHEIDCFVEAMLERAVKFPRPGGDSPIVDTCGTGGDAMGTFNVSTAAAFIAAACGVRIAKHGNRSASSQCGSADVLEAIGYNIHQSPLEAAGQLDKFKFCFLFAPDYHPAMVHAAQVRREMKIRTLFNLCGPLANPVRPDCQLVGVASPELMEPTVQALKALGRRAALVVHGADGLDEISTCQVTEGIFLDGNGQMNSWSFSPGDVGVKPVEVADIQGGDPAENARILRMILEGQSGPRADIANINAGAILWLAGVEMDIQHGYMHAKRIQESGRGFHLLAQLCPPSTQI